MNVLSVLLEDTQIRFAFETTYLKRILVGGDYRHHSLIDRDCLRPMRLLGCGGLCLGTTVSGFRYAQAFITGRPNQGSEFY